MPAKKTTTKTTKKTAKKTAKKAVKKTAKKTTSTTTKKSSAKISSSKKKVNVNSQAYYDLIAKEAYFLFEKSGYSHGNDQHNWYEAEKRIKKEFGIK